MKRILIAVALTLIFAAPAHAKSLAGVTMPDNISVNGKALVLNGLGLRKKSIIKVYVAGLYLPQRMKGGRTIIAADTERRLIMDFLRGVSGSKICNAWNEGLVKNTKDPSAEVKAQFKTLCSYMEDVPSGGKYIFTYVPGQGTAVNINGKMKGTIPGKAFNDALMKCLIGPNPPGEAFKAGLVSGV